MYIPDKGDIVYIDFDPSGGKGITKCRLAFVLSRKVFNNHTGFVIVAPITGTIRKVKLEVALPSSMTTKGSVLTHQIRSLDFKARNIKFIEKSPKEIFNKVTALSIAIIK